ncbi:MAG: zf-HC2 domain-containing protein [Candidatus Riflebacteria bacterium]|nr:zf-HC2 domain-containing protein [Candidatus Riflebacteria bacterium]
MTNCQNIRELMIDFDSNDISATDRNVVENHLAICSECRNELEILRKMIQGMKQEVFSRLPRYPLFEIPDDVQSDNTSDSNTSQNALNTRSLNKQSAFETAKTASGKKIAAAQTTAPVAVTASVSSMLSAAGVIAFITLAAAGLLNYFPQSKSSRIQSMTGPSQIASETAESATVSSFSSDAGSAYVNASSDFDISAFSTSQSLKAATLSAPVSSKISSLSVTKISFIEKANTGTGFSSATSSKANLPDNSSATVDAVVSSQSQIVNEAPEDISPENILIGN